MWTGFVRHISSGCTESPQHTDGSVVSKSSDPLLQNYSYELCLTAICDGSDDTILWFISCNEERTLLWDAKH